MLIDRLIIRLINYELNACILNEYASKLWKINCICFKSIYFLFNYEWVLLAGNTFSNVCF